MAAPTIAPYALLRHSLAAAAVVAVSCGRKLDPSPFPARSVIKAAVSQAGGLRLLGGGDGDWLDRGSARATPGRHTAPCTDRRRDTGSLPKPATQRVRSIEFAHTYKVRPVLPT